MLGTGLTGRELTQGGPKSERRKPGQKRIHSYLITNHETQPEKENGSQQSMRLPTVHPGKSDHLTSFLLSFWTSTVYKIFRMLIKIIQELSTLLVIILK